MREQRDLAGGERLPVFCYPKRWDSISFYLEREDVAVVTPAREQELFDGVRREGRALLFVRRRDALHDLLQALPEGMEFVPRGRQGSNVVTGVVQLREKRIPRE